MCAASRMIDVSFKSLLVPTDFSIASDLALSYAEGIARRYGGKICLAHVVPDEVYVDIPLGQRDSALQHAQASVERQIVGLKQHTRLHEIPHQVVIDHGDICPILSDIADKNDIDLIVVGTQGRRGLEKLLSGSTAERIIRLARQPVLTVGPHCTRDSTVELKFESILYASDCSRPSVRALDHALSLSKQYNARFFFLHVSEGFGETADDIKRRSAQFLDARLSEFGLSRAMAEIEPEYLVDYGSDVAKYILAASDQRDMALIVLSMQSTEQGIVTFEAHKPGPIPYTVAAQSSCPVLTVRGITECQP